MTLSGGFQAQNSCVIEGVLSCVYGKFIAPLVSWPNETCQDTLCMHLCVCVCVCVLLEFKFYMLNYFYVLSFIGLKMLKDS